MTILEKTAYIKGLCEGLELDKKDTAEARVIKALLDLCQDMAEEIDALGSDVEDLIDYCEELDEDLGDVEEILLDEEEDDEWDDECDCCCDCDDCDCECDCDEDEELTCYIMKVVTTTDEDGEEIEEFLPVEDEALEAKLIEVAQNKLESDDDLED